MEDLLEIKWVGIQFRLTRTSTQIKPSLNFYSILCSIRINNLENRSVLQFAKPCDFFFWGPGDVKAYKIYILKKKPKTKRPNPIETKAKQNQNKPWSWKPGTILRFLLSAHWRQKLPVPAAAKNTHATTQLRHVIAADSLTRHHDRHEPPTASEPQPKTVAVLPTATPHVSLISPLSNQRQSTTTVPQQPQSTTETHDRSSRQPPTSPRQQPQRTSLSKKR